MASATACARVQTPKVSWMSWTSVLTVRSESWRSVSDRPRIGTPGEELQNLDPAGTHDTTVQPAQTRRLDLQAGCGGANARQELLGAHALVWQRRLDVRRRVTAFRASESGMARQTTGHYSRTPSSNFEQTTATSRPVFRVGRFRVFLYHLSRSMHIQPSR